MSDLQIHQKIKSKENEDDIIKFIINSNLTKEQLNLKDYYGETIFFLAVQNKLEKLINYLVSREDINLTVEYNTNNAGDQVVEDSKYNLLEVVSANPPLSQEQEQEKMYLIQKTITEEEQMGGGADLTTLSLSNMGTTLNNNETSIGNTLSNIVERILSGGNKNRSKLMGTRYLNMSSDTILSGGDETDSSDDDKLRKMIKSQKNETVEKLFSKIKSLISDKGGRIHDQKVSSNDRDVSLIKSFLYQKIKKQRPELNSTEKFNKLNDMSEDQLYDMLKDLPDLNKIESDISEHMAKKQSETTSVSSNSSLSFTDMPKKSKAKAKPKEKKASSSKKSSSKKSKSKK
jgi:hypothetical protein